MKNVFGAKFSFILGSLLIVATLGSWLAPQVAEAHGRRDLAGGKYQLVFGFLTEPAFAGQMNGIDLTVCEGACKTQDGKVLNPVKEVEKTLKAEAIYGSQKINVELKARYNMDGKYAGYFLPAAAGEYTFRFFGTIGGEKVDEQVVSGKDGFSSAENSLTLGTADSAAKPNAALEQSVKEARDQASTATIFGIIGLVLGLLGVGVGVFGLTRGQKAVTPERELTGAGSRSNLGG